MDVESKNGVIQSSIALLQERFRQLQKEKEMRQRRELLKSTMITKSSSSSFSSSSSSDSESENYNYISHSAAATTTDRLKLMLSDEVAMVPQPPPQLSPPLPPQHRHLVALSLWPTEDVNTSIANYNYNAPTLVKSLRGAKKEEHDKRLCSFGCLSCGDSRACDDVDTSLRL